jgi:thioredoxin reductase (NADPH)
LRAAKCIQERCFANDKIEMRWDRVPSQIKGHEGRVTGVVLQSTIGEPDEVLELQGVFEFIGVHPNSELVAGLAELTEVGWVKVDATMTTSVPGLWAAGDVTNTPLKQVVTAAGQGATAAFEALRYLDSGTCPL